MDFESRNGVACECEAPGIAGLPSRGQQDEIFPFAPFTDRGSNDSIKGVVLIRLVDHLALPAEETQQEAEK